MKMIASWSFKPFLAGTSTGWINTETFLACAKLSVERVHEHFKVKPTVYTDELGAEIFNKIGMRADFDTSLENVYDEVDLGVWAYPKIVTYSKQTEPYIHFDLDFLFEKPIGEDWLDCDVGFQWAEDLTVKVPNVPDPFRGAYNLGTHGWNYNLTPPFNNPYANHVKAPCVGMLYMNNMKLNRDYTRNVENFIFNNRPLLNDPATQVHSCVLEQQALGLEIQRGGYRTNVLQEWEFGAVPMNESYTHFMGHDWKQSEEYPTLNKMRERLFTPYINHAVKKSANLIDKLRGC